MNARLVGGPADGATYPVPHVHPLMRLRFSASPHRHVYYDFDRVDPDGTPIFFWNHGHESNGRLPLEPPVPTPDS